MSSSIDTVVVPDVELADAAQLGKLVTDHLVQRGIVVPAPDPTTCECQFVEGPNASEAARAINRLRYTGLNVVVGRTVFHPGGNGLDTLTCPNCGREVAESKVAWSDALNEWYGGNDSAGLSCPDCNVPSPVTQWRFHPAWALGCLGFRFEEWFLKDEFVESVSSLLNRRVILVSCHL